MKTNEQKLKEAISSLIMMKDITEKVYNDNIKVFKGNKDLAKSYKELVGRISISIERLKNPKLSIATVGTTTAGKSTIVNALAGRTIAPMEIDETSAGVLRLLPGDERSLEIAYSPYWESGKFMSITDKDAYLKIQEIFQKFGAYSTYDLGVCLNPIVEIPWVTTQDSKVKLSEIEQLHLSDLKKSNEVIEYLFS